MKYQILTSCPYGMVTANEVDLLTEIYVIYMEPNQAPRPIGCSRGACDGRLEGRKEGGRKARKYIMTSGYLLFFAFSVKHSPIGSERNTGKYAKRCFTRTVVLLEYFTFLKIVANYLYNWKWIYCRVPARWGVQQTTLAPGSNETWARDPLVR